MHQLSIKVKLAFGGLLIAIVGLVAAGCGGTGSPDSSDQSGGSGEGGFTIGMVPKTTGEAFFVAANEGAEEAAEELGDELVYNGPPTNDTAGQVQVIEQLAQQHVDAITVSALDPNAPVPAMEAAESSGIKTSAWNADLSAGRELFQNNPSAAALGKTMADQMIEGVGDKADILVITSTLSAPNQAEWLEAMEEYIDKEHPELNIQKVLPGQAETAVSYNVAKTWLDAHPETKGIIALDGNGLAGAAKAVDALGKKGQVVLTGIGVPSQNGPDIKNGTVKSAVLWDPATLGYATVYMVHAQLEGKVKPGDKVLDAGKLGELEFENEYTIGLGEPLVFTKENVDEYDF